MKIENKCKECGNVESIIYKCDVCGKEIFLREIEIRIDLEEYDFCSLGHAIKFLSEELIKQQSQEEENEITP
jgi:hypothetical protein